MAVAEAANPVAALPSKVAVQQVEPAPTPIQRHDLEVLTRQLVLALSAFAALAAFACAVLAKRPYLSAAFCAAAAALCTGAVGTILGKLIIVSTGQTSQEGTKAAPKQ